MPSDLQEQLTEHRIETAAMRADIDNVKNAQADMNRHVVSALGELKAVMESFRAALESVPQQISSCRQDMRNEVEKDFPSKLDAVHMERSIENKVDAGDNRLSEQIRATEASLGARMVEMMAASDKRQNDIKSSFETRLSAIERTVDRMWIKVTTAITVVGTVIAGIVWIMDKWHILHAVAAASG